ncbi:MAG: hypothetical protein GY696_20630 [Gammaproteobacteria bacterium]|nr:hypothetical protein [Gammaproteobacteria bacterium]
MLLKKSCKHTRLTNRSFGCRKIESCYIRWERVPRQNRQAQGQCCGKARTHVEDREMPHRRRVVDALEHVKRLYEADGLVVVEA